MKALVFGETGQVARELVRRAPEGVVVTTLGRDRADLSDPAACAAAIMASDADVCINAAAWTAVDKAEAEESAARVVNGDAPTAMAKACAERGMPFVHISTDYVFDGQGTAPFRTNDPVGPLGAYGRTKLLGEEGVRAAGGTHAILRTSWVFSAHGANFVKTMLRLGASRDSLNVVADQIGGPTSAASIADAVFAIAARLGHSNSGTYHFSGAPDASWADFARAIMTKAKLGCTVNDITSAEYPTPARRPLNSRLDCVDLKLAFGIERPNWHHCLDDVLAELGAKA